MKPLGLALLLSLLPAAAHAELDLPYQASLETPFGILTVIDADLDGFAGKQVALGGNPIKGTADAFVDIRGLLPAADPALAQPVLISLANGGNGCPLLWAVLTLTAQGSTATEPFGTCSEAILAINSAGPTLTIDMASFDPAIEKVTYTIAGTTVTEAHVPRSNEGAVAAGAGADVTRWIGQHPMMPFEDAGERLRFETIMTQQQVYDLAARVTVASPAEEQDGFVIGQGFDPNSGGSVAGLWGIRISDGLPFAIFRNDGVEPLVLGLPKADLPAAATDFMTTP